MIGTLESLLRAKPGTVLPQEAPAVAQDSSLGPRIDALETQITALTSHIEQIGKQMSAFEAKLSAAPMPRPRRRRQAPNRRRSGRVRRLRRRPIAPPPPLHPRAATTAILPNSAGTAPSPAATSSPLCSSARPLPTRKT